MRRGVNSCTFIGNLGADPELRYSQQGSAIANFNIAVSETWKDKNTGQKQEKTEWIRIVAFNRLGEVCGEYLRKGSKVYVEGQLRTRKWQDQSGQDRYTTEIVAREMQMLDGKQRDDGQHQPEAPTPSAPAQTGKANHHPPAFPDSDGYSGKPPGSFEDFDDPPF